MKKIIALLLVGLTAQASDISPGYSFSSTELVTAQKLTSLVSASTINTDFITGKATATANGADSLIFYSVSGAALRKGSYSAMFLNNKTIISGQTETTTPALADYLLLYSVTGDALFKVSITNVFGSLGIGLSVSNALAVYNPYSVNFTNLAVDVTIVGGDRLLIWDSSVGSNRQTTVAGLITNATQDLTADGQTVFAGVTTNGYSKIALTNLNTYLTNLVQASFPVLTNTVFTSGLYSIPAGGFTISTNHGFGVTPFFAKWMYVCVTNNEANGFAQNQEVPALAIYQTVTGNLNCTPSSGPTNISLVMETGTGLVIKTFGGGAGASITTSDWRIRMTATRP